MGFVDPTGRGVIVVADDNAYCRAAVRRALERERYLVLEARDGEEALEILRSGTAPAVRLIVLDLVMPKMAGWSLLETLRSERALADIPVLVTSAGAIQHGAAGIGTAVPFLRKPFSREDLLSAVSAAADLTAARERLGAARAHRAGDALPATSEHEK
jgi:two-component system, chemotaxis family, chemotaxis protein CheY